MIAAFRDEQGLRIAAAELFEEAFEAPRDAAGGEAAGEDDGRRETRTLAEGYYMWLNSAVETLERPLEAGVHFREGSLWPEEMLALIVLRDARAEFRRKHPPCRGCGKLLAFEFQSMCTNCQFEADKRARGR